MVLNKKWTLRSRPNGIFDPKIAELSTEKIEENDLDPDETLVKISKLSVDAFIRTMMDEEAYHGSVDLGSTIPAFGYGMVESCGSNVTSLKKGDVVVGLMGAQTYCKTKTSTLFKHRLPFVDPSISLGLLSLTTGLTAYVGTFYVGKRPRKGETAVVSAASGAVGSVAAQLARISGARVVGIAGGEKKCKYLIDELKLDDCIDYKSEDKTLEEQLKESCPNGVDFFYDNVGGTTLDAVLESINPKGRIVVCGAISQYSGNLNKGKVHGPSSYLKLAERGASMAGFNVMQYMSSLPKAMFWILWYKWRGQLSLKMHVENGIESFPSALQQLFVGGHTGKMIVDVASGIVNKE